MKGQIKLWSLGIFLLFCGVFLVNPLSAALLDEGYQPLITLEKVALEQAVAGSEFSLTLHLRNISTNPAFNLDLDFKVKDSKKEEPCYPFTLKNGESKKIAQLASGESRTLVLTFAVDSAAQNKDYEMVLNLSGEDLTFQKTVNTMTNMIIPVTYDLTKPILMVENLTLHPQEPAEEEEFEVSFQIKNLSKTTEARNIMFFLEGEENFRIMDISNRKNLAKLAKGTTETITYKLKPLDKRKANLVKLKITFDYLGESQESLAEILNLPLADPVDDDDEAIGVTPWVIVHKYTLSTARILAGNTVTLKLHIENTNQKPVKNVKISLGVIKLEDSGGGVETTRTGGTVFSPVNSSNSFYVENIPGKTIIEKDVALYVDPNAAAKTYIVPVDIKYEDKDGKTLSCEELVNIPVTQECKLEVLDLELPGEVFVDEPVFIAAEFVNVGKVTLDNFMVTLEGDFPKENSTYYVGNLEIGLSDFYQGTLIPQEEGTLEGSLVFTYIDNNNQDVRVEKPFSIEVQTRVAGPGEAGPDFGPGDKFEPGMEAGVSGGKIGNLFKSKGFTVFLFLVILIEAVCLFRIKRKKATGEFFDE